MANQNAKTEPFITLPFRLAFPALFKPRAYEAGGREIYSAVLLFPKAGQKPLIASMPGDGMLALRKAAYDACVKQWGPNPKQWPAALQAYNFKTGFSPTGKDGFPFRDGDTKNSAGFAGMSYVSASSTLPVGVADCKRQDIIDPNKVYGGLICRAQVNAYCFTGRSMGVTIGLSNIQVLMDDGVKFGGAGSASSVFDAFAEGNLPGGAGPDSDPWAGGFEEPNSAQPGGFEATNPFGEAQGAAGFEPPF